MKDDSIIPPGEVLPPSEPAPARPKGRKASKPAGKSPKAQQAGRFAVLNAFVDVSMAGLPRAQITVWFVLFRETREGTARISVGQIANRAGVSYSKTVQAIKQLEERGLVEVVYRGGLNQGSSIYRAYGHPRDPP